MRVLLLITFCFSVYAEPNCDSISAPLIPEEGLWHNMEEPGRGITIEMQNGVLVATIFGYSEDGDAQWWQGVGNLQEGTYNTYAGGMIALNNGQCFGCDYNGYELDEQNVLGDFILRFISWNTAEFSWPGGSTIVEKYHYGIDDRNPLNFLLGTWTFSVHDSNLLGLHVSGHVIRFDRTETIDGENTVQGNHVGFGGGDFPAVGYLPTAEEIEILSNEIDACNSPGASDSISFVKLVYFDGNGALYTYLLGINENMALGSVSIETGGLIYYYSAAGLNMLNKFETQYIMDNN